MIPRKNMRIMLAVFQLLVFLAPILIKSQHHHEEAVSIISGNMSGNVLTKTQKVCSICDFEFLSFVKPPDFIISAHRLSWDENKGDNISSENHGPLVLFTTRAPPLS